MAAWTVLVPVRSGPEAKTRLGAPAGLADALAEDCLTAVAACRRVRRLVVLIAGEPELDLPARAEVLRQPPRVTGLRTAIRHGLAELNDQPTAVLLADLPALTPQALTAGLRAAEAALADGAIACHVPDADGTGTVLLAGPVADRLPVRFGPSSAAATAAAGSVPLTGLPAALTRDVDTAADLAAAWRLGTGAHTRARLAPVQVSVLDYDPDHGTGHVVTDDGLRLPLASTALAGSGLRFLRPGQRLSCLVTTGPEGGQIVTAVRLRGIGTPLPAEG